MTGENAKKPERVTERVTERQRQRERGLWGKVGGGQGFPGCSTNSIFILRKIGRNGRIVSKGVASHLPFQRIPLAAGWRRDGWMGGMAHEGSVGNVLLSVGTRQCWTWRGVAGPKGDVGREDEEGGKGASINSVPSHLIPKGRS